ncbi:unnamed protein product, partial [Iphiclides podalirius]
MSTIPKLFNYVDDAALECTGAMKFSAQAQRFRERRYITTGGQYLVSKHLTIVDINIEDIINQPKASGIDFGCSIWAWRRADTEPT